MELDNESLARDLAERGRESDALDVIDEALRHIDKPEQLIAIRDTIVSRDC